jgi:integral membrane protein
VSPHALFRLAAVAEAVSWTLLLAGMAARALTGWTVGVSIGGGIHGFVFLAFVAVVLLVAVHQRWSAGVTLLALVAAIVPYATIPADIVLVRTGRLAGRWRLEAGDDPRDRRPLDRAVRALLRHPWRTAAVLAALVVLVFVALLVAGPPGG